MFFRFYNSLNIKSFRRQSYLKQCLGSGTSFNGFLSSYGFLNARMVHKDPPLLSDKERHGPLGSMTTSFRVFGDKEKQPTTRILFCGPDFPASHNYTAEYLQNYPYIQVDVVDFYHLPDLIGNYDMCVVKSLSLDADLIALATRMKLIMQFGVGLEGVDTTAATNHGIKVARIPSAKTGNAASCAEMAIYLMLGLLRKQNEMQLATKKKLLGEPIGETLLGKTVLIMGFGNIGIELAKRLRPFGVKIIATKRNWSSDVPNPGNSNESTTQSVTCEDLVDEKVCHKDIYNFLKISDIVVCCLTMNRETTRIVDDQFLSSMKKGCLLVNIARGGLLDYMDVSNHLKSGHLGGLAMDVTWTEPFNPENGIFIFPNVIHTPHVAGVTEYSYRSMAKVVGDVALQLHEGIPPTGIEYVN